MKIPEAQAMYRAYRQDLIEQRKSLIRQRDEAQHKYETTGASEFSEQAATLQLSLEATQEKFDANQKVLDALIERYAAVWNAEVAKQQADATEDAAAEYTKIMTVAMRISRGDIVPYTDEKKLLEASPDLYQAAKSAQMMHQLDEKRKKHDSLWKDEEETEEQYDPKGKADNAEAPFGLPEIPETGTAASEMPVSEIAPETAELS